MRVSVACHEYGAGLSKEEIRELLEGVPLQTVLNQVSIKHSRTRQVTMRLAEQVRNDAGVEIRHVPEGRAWKYVTQVEICVDRRCLNEITSKRAYLGVRYDGEHTIDFLLEDSVI